MSRPHDIDDLVLLCLERVEAGDEDALEEVCAEHPEHADELRRRVRHLRDMGLLAAGEDPGEPEIPKRLGEFRLKRLLGRGGMGVVYLAEQEGLGREVALKLIRPDLLYFPETRARFRREVETVARLHHPGIVPIYTVGEERGIPYFAMERIVGCSVEDALRRVGETGETKTRGADLARAVAACCGASPDEAEGVYLFRGSWERAALEIAREVAAALDHAHAMGVLHRDIKPSNIMLTPTGRVLLVDFGLAAREGAGSITRSGSQLGSVYYMAPEQARGDAEAISARTDVYSLGVTLFELLTLARPFSGRDVSAVLDAICRATPPRPRTLRPSVSWEAEAVCLTAMDPEPSRRYKSAADFARDLQNALSGRPIEARRPSWIRAAWRAARRNKAAFAATALAAMIAIGGPIGYAIVQARALEETERQRDRARKSLGHTLDTIDRLLVRIGDESLANTPQATELRRLFLDEALRSLGALLADESEDPEVKLATARTRMRVASIRALLGETEAAERDYERAIAELERLGDAGDDVERERSLGLARMRLAALRYFDADSGRSEQIARAAARDLAELAAAHPSRGDLALDALRARVTLGRLLYAQARFEDALDVASAAHAEAPAIEASPEQLESSIAAEKLRGDAALALGRVDEADRAYDAAVASARELARRSEAVEARRVFATILAERGRAYLVTDRAELGLRGLEEAAFEMGRLVADHPARADLRETLAKIHVVCGECAPDPTRAEEHLERGRADLERLVTDYPDTPGFRANLASCLGALGDLRAAAGRADEAAADYGRAVSLLERLEEEQPTDPVHPAQLGLNLDGLGSIHAARGEQEPAARAFADAVGALRRAQAKNPDDPRVFLWLADACYKLSGALRVQGDLDASVEAAIAGADAAPQDGGAALQAAWSLAATAAVLQQADDSERAAAVRARAIEILRRAVEAGIDDPAGALASAAFDPIRHDPEFERLLEEIPD